ncbi:MAG: hypothetical protein ABIR96_05150, partial [Bdellovibrionota bacterium]
EGGYTVKKNPGLNYYVGWDLGVSNMVLSKIGSLVVASTAFDSGGTIGLNYALFDGVALNTGASVSYVMGFTSLAVTGLAMKFYVGVTF